MNQVDYLVEREEAEMEASAILASRDERAPEVWQSLLRRTVHERPGIAAKMESGFVTVQTSDVFGEVAQGSGLKQVVLITGTEIGLSPAMYVYSYGGQGWGAGGRVYDDLKHGEATFQAMCRALYVVGKAEVGPECIQDLRTGVFDAKSSHGYLGTFPTFTCCGGLTRAEYVGVKEPQEDGFLRGQVRHECLHSFGHERHTRTFDIEVRSVYIGGETSATG